MSFGLNIASIHTIMDSSHLKTQIMTMFMMRPKSGENNNDIFMIMYSMILMNFMEVIFRNAPQAFAVLQTFLLQYLKPKKENWIPLMNTSANEKNQVNSISMMRIFEDDSEKPSKQGNVYVDKVDAVLDYICSLDNAKHIKMDTRYTLNSTDEIELTPLLKAKVKESGQENGSVIEIVIFSKVLKVSEIRQWIDEIHCNYTFEKNNKLGNRIYYFNEVPIEPIIQCEMDPAGGPPKQSYRWENMPKMLTFNMNEFNTSKSFGNVYGSHVNELKERLDLFINRPDWYMERGIPHSLGILFHGVPGAGKTSTIKAIAKDTHRHIFNLSLRPYTSQRQLTNLFFNETVIVYGHDGNKQTLKIPLNRRVYVIEDIDCLTDVVLDRTITGGKNNRVDGDAVTLSFLLNLLDGVLETPGRILVITSNFPEKLDRAFVRPGRIDVQIEFKRASRSFVLDMVNKFYTLEYTLDEIPTELDNVFTPAEIMESMCTHFKQPKKAIEHMVHKIGVKQIADENAKGMLLDQFDSPNTFVVTPPPEQETVILPTEKKEEPIIIPPATNVVKAARTVQTISLEYGWANADFPSAEFLPGGNMPGDLGVRSLIDLNNQ